LTTSSTKKGFQLCLADDQGLQRLGEPLSGKHRLGHLNAVLGGQMIEGHTCVVGLLPEGMDIGRAAGEKAQHPVGEDAVDGEE
jgi:hypothetical protein